MKAAKCPWSLRFKTMLLYGCACGFLLPAGRSLASRFTQSRSAADQVVLTFCTVGDSRADPDDPALSPQDKIWLQNTKVLSRFIREMQAQKPNALFFNGDMIKGYSINSNLLNRQYGYWRGMMSALLETGTYLVPVPGNHEVQLKLEPDDPKGEPIKIAQ